MKHRSIVTVATLVVAALLALTITTGPAAQASSEMSTARAGQYYLKVVCAGNDASHVFYDRVWHGRSSITTAEVRGRLPELRRLSKAYAHALQKESRDLFNPPAAWPDSVTKYVDRFATAFAKEATFRGGEAYSTTASSWMSLNGRANGVSYGSYTSIIRATLGLPAPGHGC